MAEVLGIVSSIAGLASLSIEIGKGIRTLKIRVATVKDLPQTVDRIETQLTVLESIRHRIQSPTNGAQNETSELETLLRLCVDDYNAISRALGALQARITAPNEKARGLRLRGLGLRDSSLLSELQVVDRLTADAYNHFTLLRVHSVLHRIRDAPMEC